MKLKKAQEIARIKAQELVEKEHIEFAKEFNKLSQFDKQIN